MAAPNVGELVASTWWKQGSSISDIISDNTMLYKRLRQQGRKNMVDGGREIREPLAYGDNTTFGWYQGYQPLSVAPTQQLDVAIYSPKQCAVAITISGREQRMNRSDAELIDLLDTRMGNAEKSMANQMSEAAYGDGTGSGGQSIIGLKNLIPADPTSGTAGGISRASHEWWRSTKVGGPATKTTVEEKFNQLYAQLCRGTDKPDLVVVDNTMWQLFVNVLQQKQRFVNSADKAVQGFPATKYMNADVVLDGGKRYGGRTGMSDNTAYFINSNTLRLKTYTGANMQPAPGGARYPVDQDAEVHHILWMGALCASNLSLNGVITKAA